MMVSGRSLEAGTALLTGAFGVAVVVSSLDNGIGWSPAGVDAGTFPFIVASVINSPPVTVAAPLEVSSSTDRINR